MQEKEMVMPRKPKRPCSFQNCPELVDGRFCDKHQKEENRRYEKYDRKYNPHKRYGRAWKRIRDSFVKTHPFCKLCFDQGFLREVEQVHHILPIAEGGTHEINNLMSLCQSCHSKLHANRGDRWKSKGVGG